MALPQGERNAPPLTRQPIARHIALLAFLSGIPSLVYQVVWTREVALLAGSQVEAISLVLVVFFGGLALGAARLGAVADRAPSPVRLYGGLEVAAGLAAACSIWLLRSLGGAAPEGPLPLLLACGAVLLPATFLLGGTLPALLRAQTRDPEVAASRAGVVVGANTAGAVAGVALAVLAIPTAGLRASLLAASALAVGVGLLAIALGRPSASPGASPDEPVRPGVLLAAALAGAATLGTEVLAARLATLRLGSSLYAWGLVLALFLAGLAAGNLALAQRARKSAHPERDLGWIEIAAACTAALGLGAIRPDVATPASGVSAVGVFTVVLGVFPAALAMGGAFPLFVRLAVAGPRIGASFGRVSAANTAGGIAGALLAPFALLPALGSVGTVLTFAAANALIGMRFLRAESAPWRGARRQGAALALALACVPLWLPRTPTADPWVLFVAEGRQATAVVTGTAGNRALLVDGDPEAATAGDARRTEELLAVLPLLLHPSPRSFLEVGLGSGITLGTAHRFALDRLDCVEIAPSVLRAARYFEPDNGGVTTSGDATIAIGDARIFLARHPEAYDIVVANTLHPWSIGATGLYSREYYTRLAGSLRAGGLAIQWLPTAQIGGESVALVLRTFFNVFPHGGLWWGAGDVIAVGAIDALRPRTGSEMENRLERVGFGWGRVGVADAAELEAQQIAGADAVRSGLGPGDVLVDDRPVLEVRAAGRRGSASRAEVYALLVRIAEAGVREELRSGGVLLWLESLAARAGGNAERANALERLAANAGVGAAVRARARRLVAEAERSFVAEDLAAADSALRRALAIDPSQRDALFGLAGIEIRRGDLAAASGRLQTLLAHQPDDAPALNELSGLMAKLGNRDEAVRWNAEALRSDPFYLAALANAGLLAADAGDRRQAAEMLARIRAVSPLGTSEPEKALAATLR